MDDYQPDSALLSFADFNRLEQPDKRFPRLSLSSPRTSSSRSRSDPAVAFCREPARPRSARAAVLRGRPECLRIPNVRPGVCPLPIVRRQPEPDATLLVLPSAAGITSGAEELSLVDLQDRVVIVNLSASWCGPRRIEQSNLNAVHALVSNSKVVLISVNVEDTEANAVTLARY